MVSQHAVQQKSFDDQRYKSKHNKTFMWQSRRLFGRHHLRVYTRKEARRASASCWCSPAMSSWRGRGETLWHLKCSELNLIYHIVYMLYRCAMIFVSYHVQVAKFHEVPHNSSFFRATTGMLLPCLTESRDGVQTAKGNDTSNQRL